MEGNTDKIDRLEDLLSTLDNPKTTRDARIDIYLVLVREISKDTPDVLEDLSQSAAMLERHLKADMKLDDSGLTQSALNALGYILHLPNIVSSFSTSVLKEFLQDLCLLLETSDDKGVCTRALWCLSRQAIPDDIISKELTRLLAVLNTCIVGKSFESSAVEFEAINVYQRLLKQCPERLLTNDDDWFKMVYPFVISKNIKVAERALKFLEKNLDLFKGKSENFSQCLINDLHEGLTDRLKIMFSKQRELFVLRVWSCYITVLGKNMHQGTPLTNSLFKVVEQAFKSHSCEVLVAAFEAWIALIDNFAISKAAILSKKRLKLLLMPLINSTSKSERNSVVEQARLNCWVHLISILKDDLNEIFDQVIAPLLHFLFSVPSTNFKNVDLSLNKTPTKGAGREDVQMHTPKTPAANEFDQAVQSSPKGKNFHFDSPTLKKIGAQIIYLALKTKDTEDDSLDMNAMAPSERLSLENFMNNIIIFMLGLQDLTWKCGKDLDEKLLLAVWQCILHYVNEIAASGGENQCLSLAIGGILLTLQMLTSTDCTSQQVALRIISLCYAKLNDVISQNRDLVKTEKNPLGSFPMHLIQLLFYESRFVEDKLCNKFYALYYSLLRDVISGVSGQFSAFSQITETIKTFSATSADQDATRLLWVTTAEFLTSYINQTHEVNQGDSINHDFSAILEVLLLPVTKLFKTDLPSATMKDISLYWSNLFSSFVRESSLLSTIEENQAVEEFCLMINRLVANGEIVLTDYLFLGKLLRILSMVTENLSFTERLSENHATRPKTKSENPLKNARSLVALFEKILLVLTTVDPKKDKATDLHLGELFEIIGVYFGKITGADLIMESIDKLGSTIATFISEEKPKGGSNAPSKCGSAKKSNVGKVFNEIYACIFERYGRPLDNDLLLIMLPLLKAALSCERSVIRSRAIEFWNKSFGQMKHLICPEDLRNTLLQVKGNTGLIIPGIQVAKDDDVVIPESEESQPMSIVQSPNIRKTMTPSLRSPHKIHGSFLQKAMSAEKAGRSPSPGKMSIPKSPKSESRIKPVRRKLPLLLDHDDSNEFVRIAPSPKKRRILTEHQKEMRRSKSDVPVLYNQLDQHTQEPIFTEETLCTMDATDIHISKTDSGNIAFENATKVNKGTDDASKNDMPGLRTAEEVSEFAGGNRKTNQSKLNGRKDDVLEMLHYGSHGNKNEDIREIANTNENEELECQVKGKIERRNSVEERNRGINKPSTRRSLKTSFKDILRFIKDQTIEESMDKSDSECVKADSHDAHEEDIIPSSYTPFQSAETEQPLLFKFSSSSLFSKAAKTPEVSFVAEIESSRNAGKFADDDEIVETEANPIDKMKDSSNENISTTCQSSTSPDFIPSSQSQEDASPILKGVTMITPRRSGRKVKKTERLLKAEKAIGIKRSQPKSPQDIFFKEDSMKTIDIGRNIVDERENRKEKQDSLERLDVIREQDEVAVVSNKQENEAVIGESSESVTNGKEDNKISEKSRQDSIIAENLSEQIISISDDEMDSALCEMDLDVEPVSGGINSKKLESENEGQIIENGPQRERRKKTDDKNLDRVNDTELVAMAEMDEKVNAVVSESEKEAKGRNEQSFEKSKDEYGRNEKRNDVQRRKGSRKVNTRMIKKSLTDSSGEIQVEKRRSSRIVKVDEQTQTLVSKADDNVGQNVAKVIDIKNEKDANSLDITNKSSKIYAIKSDIMPVIISQTDSTRAEDPSFDVEKDSNDNRESLVDIEEPSVVKVTGFPSAKPKRRRKSRKLVMRKGKRNSKSTNIATFNSHEGVAEREQVDLLDSRIEESQGTEGSINLIVKKTSDGEFKLEKDLFASAMESDKKSSFVGQTSPNEPIHFVEDAISTIEDRSREKSTKSKRRTGRKLASSRRRSRAPLSRKVKDASQSMAKNVVIIENSENTRRDLEPKNNISQDQKKKAVDLDSSIVESLTMSEISRCSRKTNSVTCKQDARRILSVKTEDQGEAFKNYLEDNEFEENSTETLDQTVDVDVEGARKRKRNQFQGGIESETIENIFNSPDSPDVDRKRSVSDKEPFLVLERTVVTTNAPLEIDSTKNMKNDMISENETSENEQYNGFKIEDDPQENKIPCSSSNSDSVVERAVPENTLDKNDPQILCASVLSTGVASSPLGVRKTTDECSPLSGILKRRTGQNPDTPSPPNKNRRVSFAFPLEEKRSISNLKKLENCNELAVPFPANVENEPLERSVRGTPRRFTAIRKKVTSSKTSSSKKGPPICADLVDCIVPIENLLPSITSGSSSLGLGNFIRSQNIRTIGNLCALSVSQIEALPIRAPKVRVVKTALKKYMNIQKKGEKQRAIQSLSTNDSPSSNVKTPIKDTSKFMLSDNMVNRTPTRRSFVKPTSLFSDFEELITDSKSASKSEAKTGCDIHHMKRTEKQDEFPSCEAEIGGEIASSVPLEESKSDSLGVITVHDVPSIADNECFVSKEEDDIPQMQRDLTTTAEVSDNFNVKVGTNSELQDGLSNIYVAELEENGKLKAELGEGGTDGHEIAEESSEIQLTSHKEVESMQIIEETDEDSINGVEKAFLDSITFACFDSRDEKATNLPVAKPVLGSKTDNNEMDNTEAENLENGPAFSGDIMADATETSRIILEGGKSWAREDIDFGLDQQLSVTDPEQPNREEDVDLPQKDEDDKVQPDSVRDDISEHDITAFKKKELLNEAEYDLAEHDRNVDCCENSRVGKSLQKDKDITMNDDECIVLRQEITEFPDSKQLEKVDKELLKSEEEIIPSSGISDNVTHVDDCSAVVDENDNSNGLELQANAVPNCRLMSEDVDKFIDNLKIRIPEVALKESIAIYRKITDAQKFIFNEIERKIEEGSSQ